jgi:DNA repair ATPase RecN
METLSGVASGMAVASLTLQLLQSVGTIKTFIRDVNGATKELERLVALLDRLNALLEGVRDAMEQQTSLQGQHFPAPSQMIFDALKSCERSLESVQSITEKYKRTPNGSASTVVKLKNDIKFSFKAKDIAGFEVQIQREIDYLQFALGLNSTNIW